MHCLTAWGLWAVQLLQYTALLPAGSGQWRSCNALPHYLGAMGSGTPAMCGATSWGDGESCRAAGRCRKSGPPAMHCHTSWVQWAVELMSCIVSLPGGNGQCNSCNALRHYPGVVGSGTLAIRCLTAWGQWAVELLQCTASLPGGQGVVELLQGTATAPWGRGGGAPAAVPWTTRLGVVPRASRANQPGESSVVRPQEQDGSCRTPENALPSRPSGSQRR